MTHSHIFMVPQKGIIWCLTHIYSALGYINEQTDEKPCPHGGYILLYRND